MLGSSARRAQRLLNTALAGMNARWASPALILASFLAFAVIDAAVSGNGAASQTLGLLHMVLLAFLLFWWASTDARQRQSELSTSMIVCLVVFGFLAVPFY